MTNEQKKSKKLELDISRTRLTNLYAEIDALKAELGLERDAEAMKIAEQFNAARDTRQSPFTVVVDDGGKNNA